MFLACRGATLLVPFRDSTLRLIALSIIVSLPAFLCRMGAKAILANVHHVFATHPFAFPVVEGEANGLSGSVREEPPFRVPLWSSFALRIPSGWGGAVASGLFLSFLRKLFLETFFLTFVLLLLLWTFFVLREVRCCTCASRLIAPFP